MTRDFRDAIVIAGVGESEIGILPHRTELQLHAQAAVRALKDAGLQLREVDGVLSIGSGRGTRFPSMQVAEYLGITPRFTDSTSLGGCSFEAYVQHAAMAIHAGLCTTCLITYGSTQRSSAAGFGSSTDPWLPQSQFESSWGLPMMTGAYSLAAARHMHLYGTTRTHLAEIAVAARKWAQLNPRAASQKDLSIQDVLTAPPIATPLGKYDCCLVTDGGGAVVVTRADRAADLPQAPVWLWGSAETHTHVSIANMPDLTVTPAAITGPAAFASAGVRPGDMDLAMIYDSFTITALMTLEDLGFCAKGEGGDFVSGGRIAPGGDFAMNTNGGGLSYTHPGMYGIFLLTEAVQQLRGAAGARQLSRCDLAVVHGTGGALSAGSTLILSSEKRA